MERIPLYQFNQGPYSAGTSQFCTLINGAVNVPAEGLWTPINLLWYASVQVTGSISTLSAQIYGSNQNDAPLNTYTATVGGVPLAGNSYTLTFNAALVMQNVVITYTAVSGDTVTSIAASLAALINANTSLAVTGLVATSSAGVVTMQWPTLANGESYTSYTQPPIANRIALFASTSGGTFTAACGTDGYALTSAITSLGIVSAVNSLPVRWIKGRITTLTGTNANASILLTGVV